MLAAAVPEALAASGGRFMEFDDLQAVKRWYELPGGQGAARVV